MNLDKKETISLSSGGDIKASAYIGWSPQLAILSEFLGAYPYPYRFRLGFKADARWSGDRIRIENDGEPSETEADAQGWPDVGEMYLSVLARDYHLENWFRFHLLPLNTDLISAITKKGAAMRLV